MRLCGGILADRNQVPRRGNPLQRGPVEGNVITCPWHGCQFDLVSGECLPVPHVQREPCPVRVHGQRVWVRPS
ncbi:Rieske (2Fe-2S) protein [Thermus scotoductus]|uniref:Rieske (2Fe-2S) protein n=1 Tax=Thermus scotoductus TaxID=37636 RepID=UPI0020A37876|nr:Rieske 2Fe-2S domain-containing protein [Thermus scotoductus]